MLIPIRKGARPKRQQVRAQPARRAQAVRRPPQGQVVLSRPALRYMLAIADPWHEQALHSSIPMSAGMTHKVCGFVRGQFEIGTGGHGFIFISPTLARDAPMITHTNVAFTHNYFSVLTGLDTLEAGVNMVPMANLPYSSNQLIADDNVPAVTGRIVSVSVRVKYTGTELNRSGLSYGFRSPRHSSVQTTAAGNAASIDYLGTHFETYIRSNERKQFSVNDHAIRQSELELSQMAQFEFANLQNARTAAIYPYSRTNKAWTTVGGVEWTIDNGVNQGYVGAPTMVIAVTGVNGSPYQYEVITHVEYSGVAATASSTPTHSDAQGTQRVIAAAHRAGLVRHNTQAAGTGNIMYSEIRAALKAGEDDVKDEIVPVVESGLSAILHSV